MFRRAAHAAVVLLAGTLGVAEAQASRPPASDESARSLYLLGELNEKKHDLAAAAEAYERALQQSPELAVAHDRLGFVRGQLGQTDVAIHHFARAVTLDPALFDAQYHL